MNQRHNITKLYSSVGYGEDRYGGSTVDLLQTISHKIGHIKTFNGMKYFTEWQLKL